MTKERLAYLSLGSNIGNKLYYIVSAIQRINITNGVSVSKISSFYKTDPWGVKEQASFYNIALEIKTTLLPFELLRNLQRIETELSRTRELRWGPRTIDIDIIFYGDLKISIEELTVPHPRYRDRNFVLKPMYEIYPHNELLLKYMKRDTSKIKKIIPKILVSSCLLGENCNYKGGNNKSDLLVKLEDSVSYLRICPEVMGGLGIPRIPAEIKNNRVITKENNDVTDEFNKGASLALEKALKNNCSLAIIKGKSPSCGYGKIYSGDFTGNLVEGEGITAKLLIKNKIDIISV
ncbi:2-amino-4-hydroxy-6-hydroxymethyldihydropteridine diphosphokinase [uncultured Ilyobacter sp.]|uniref:2-amino-4-hydroxy-6- hydroxymethyldihydropteridine diphosphokinase n=1 Tax=uncultured Ilyobacter sp. TaxID=544433 RepID=UPI0029F538CE|nr:2-amino-4-hydroxy-6-hydroxymethyldihydropteridine diphosphokinase [uncultured Ilyobacter sp.]